MYKVFKQIKQITNNKEDENDCFDLYLSEEGTLEFWVKNKVLNYNICLIYKLNVTKEQYENLCYMLYKHQVDVYWEE